jgi:RimJ/RimL family protein N-acetyltransferase
MLNEGLQRPGAAESGGGPVADPASANGVVAIGQLVSLGWPLPPEFDAITALRNSPWVRRWFLDDRALDPVANRAWLDRSRGRLTDTLLAIRFTETGEFLGPIGWSDGDVVRGTASVGRLALDGQAVRRLVPRLPPDYPGFAIDACRTIRDYGFRELGLIEARTYFLAGNRLSEHVQRAIGLREVGRSLRARGDGTLVETVEMAMTRADWDALRQAEQDAGRSR